MRFLLILFSAVSYAGVTGFGVKDNGAGLDLVTPWGNKALVGEYAPDNNSSFRIEIPLSELRPPEPPAETKREPTNAPTAGPLALQPIVLNNSLPLAPPAPAPPPPPAEVKLPEKLRVEYDDTDRFVIEANRLYNRGKFYESLQMVEELLRKNPEHVRGWIMKGSLLTVMKQRDLATRAYQRALSLDPQNAELLALVKEKK